MTELEKFDTKYTALVRSRSNAYSVRHASYDYHSMKEYAEELRCNGFKVAKIFVGYVSDSEVSDWQLYNRK